MKIKNKIKFIMNNLILFLILITIIFYIYKSTSTFIDQVKLIQNEEWKNLISIQNPYLPKGEKFLWLNPKLELSKKNFPAVPGFDKQIKEDIIKNALELYKDYCIIDCGAHIGDGAIPIAHALIKLNRPDIIVYAIDPSVYKCDIMKYIAEKNNLTNLKIINCGLSKEIFTYYRLKSNNHNTGQSVWIKDKDIKNNEKIDEKMEFKTLDSLEIDKIGIIHLDVEGMEVDALLGAKNSIDKWKPYLTLENNLKHKRNKKYYLSYLPNGYKFIYNKRDNNCLKFSI
jgi:FkbM family methyltransferase